jgi:D-3-phosphoglycerate dehydrogenase
VKVLISDKLAQEGIDTLEADPDINVDVRTDLSPEELKEVIGDYEAIIVRSGTKLTADILTSACKLRAIARAGVGIDNVDVEAASRAGIVVMNTPGGNTVAAAEHTLAMMLALARNISPANASMRAGEWDRKRFMGTQLAGKTLGIIGLGRIGREVAKRAAPFGLRVIGHDPFISRDAAAAAGVALVDTIEELCRASHYITVHVPLTDQTCNMVSRDLIAKMRDGVRIINCSRGCVVNEDDLYEARTSATPEAHRVRADAGDAAPRCLYGGSAGYGGGPSRPADTRRAERPGPAERSQPAHSPGGRGALPGAFRRAGTEGGSSPGTSFKRPVP